jgi:hypothetical protein
MHTETWGTVADWISALANTALAVAAFVAVFAWKMQLKGTVEYRLARRVLARVLRLRDQVRRARSPGMPVPAAVAGDDDTAIDAKIRESYATRFDPVDRAERALESALIEAEVLWAAELRQPWKQLRELVRKMQIDTVEFFQGKVGRAKHGKEERDRLLRVVFGSYGEQDCVDRQLNAITERFGELLRQHFPQRRNGVIERMAAFLDRQLDAFGRAMRSTMERWHQMRSKH